MNINMKKNAIELTKKEAAAAAKFGTTEYKQLQEARRDYPTFSVVTVTRKTTTKKNTFKTYTIKWVYLDANGNPTGSTNIDTNAPAEEPTT